MKSLALAVLLSGLSAVPASAGLSAADAGRLAERAFALRDPDRHRHTPMDAAHIFRHDARLFWFRTHFTIGLDVYVTKTFAVDRRSGAVWERSFLGCALVEDPALDRMRATLGVTAQGSRPPSRRDCLR
ncbi:MAG: hypothetical protein JSR60_06310 [Proteobacteria bacterium]|nr:hypothetical protein [Pseudomonadota bacterium]